MKSFARSLLIPAALFFTAQAWAGSEDQSTYTAKTTVETEKVTLDLFQTQSDFVFESDLNHGGSFGSQYAAHNAFEYAHRFLLTGNLYLRAGLGAERFDFGNTSAPVPVHLQSYYGVVGFDYMSGNDIGAFLWVKPGFYTEEHIGISSFDAPITVGRIFVLQPDRLYVLVGAQAAFLRGGYPVIPFAGIIYKPSDKLTVMGTLPSPRIIYAPNDKLDVWLGGEVVGGSFRTDSHDDLPQRKLSNAQVDYEDYRAGVGFAYSPCDAISVGFGAGYSIERGFKFHRAGENYRTDPAPYVKLEIKAAF